MFNANQMNELNKVWQDKQLITISGINSFGEPFITSGKIASEENNISVGNDYIFVDFGIGLDGHKIAAPFFSDYKKLGEEQKLYILKIKADNKVIYENPQKDVILDKTILDGQKMKDQFIKDCKDIKQDDDVVKALRGLVGKRIELDGIDCILVSVGGVNNFGNAMVDVTYGYFEGSMSVGAKSKLYRIKDNERILVADNESSYENQKIINKRVENLYFETIENC